MNSEINQGTFDAQNIVSTTKGSQSLDNVLHLFHLVITNDSAANNLSYKEFIDAK